MSVNLCRCGTYPQIQDAIHEAAGTLAAGRDPGPLAAPSGRFGPSSPVAICG